MGVHPGGRGHTLGGACATRGRTALRYLCNVVIGGAPSVRLELCAFSRRRQPRARAIVVRASYEALFIQILANSNGLAG